MQLILTRNNINILILGVWSWTKSAKFFLYSLSGELWFHCNWIVEVFDCTNIRKYIWNGKLLFACTNLFQTSLIPCLHKMIGWLTLSFNCHSFLIAIKSNFFEELHETCRSVYNINKWRKEKKKFINLTFYSRKKSVYRSTTVSTLGSLLVTHLKLVGFDISLE